MNKKWNLIDFSEWEEPVLVEFTAQHRHGKRSGHSIFSHAKRAISVVALATGLAVIPVRAQATAQGFSIPYMETAVYSGPEIEPPLASIFADRFNAEWSQSSEDALLAKAHETSRRFTKSELEDQAVRSIYFNQHDTPSDSADKLTADQIKKIVRQRKLV